MSIRFASGAAEKIKKAIHDWGVFPREIRDEIWAHLEELDREDFRREKDEEGIFGGAYIHQFRIELPPVILHASIAYDLRRGDQGLEITILDFEPRFMGGEK